MALRAEISVIDDDYNVVGSVMVPLFEQDAEQFGRGPFAESVVADPDTGKVYKFTFRADLTGQIAPKREEVATPKVGDIVRIVGNTSVHHFPSDALVEVEHVYPNGAIDATGGNGAGRTINQHLFRDDYILE